MEEHRAREDMRVALLEAAAEVLSSLAQMTPEAVIWVAGFALVVCGSVLKGLRAGVPTDDMRKIVTMAVSDAVLDEIYRRSQLTEAALEEE